MGLGWTRSAASITTSLQGAGTMKTGIGGVVLAAMTRVGTRAFSSDRGTVVERSRDAGRSASACPIPLFQSKTP